MQANAVSLLAIFEKKSTLEVPLFQRQYVWNMDQQWAPLWEDISRKFLENLEGRKEAPVHFLGAMVLDQKQTPTTHVEKRQIIDGQQRLTTLQIFLSAFSDFCKSKELNELADECQSYTLNKGMMHNPEIDKFKVWPTQLDRFQFSEVITSESQEELYKKHPLIKKKYQKKYEPRPRMVECYFFFSKQIESFFLGSSDEPPFAKDFPLEDRLIECFQALKNALKVVVIDLEKDDDPQVIFETLNARGEPLLPADLLRNYIFLRAARSGEPQEELYKKYWTSFDDNFWRDLVKQGRSKRPRSDLFLQHFISSRQTIDIPLKHLFVEYKFWIERTNPFSNVEEELKILSKQGKDFRRIIEPDKDDPIFSLSNFILCFEISTIYPLLLFLLNANLDDSEYREISKILESFLLRRAICGYTAKNYNRFFLTLTRNLKKQGPTLENLRNFLIKPQGESVKWPNNEEFANYWKTQNVYKILNNAKIVYVLSKINNSFYNNKTEKIKVDGKLSIEHLLPKDWVKYWQLKDGTRGMSIDELLYSKDENPRYIATLQRNNLINTLGNLTILNQSLNSSISNEPWNKKKQEILKLSLLPINLHLSQYENWDEDSIEARSKELFEHALKIWPYPSQ